jgi:hypothetical protein
MMIPTKIQKGICILFRNNASESLVLRVSKKGNFLSDCLLLGQERLNFGISKLIDDFEPKECHQN